MATIKVNWNKYKKWCFEIVLIKIATKGGDVMFKKLLKWLKAVGKGELIKAIKSQREELEYAIAKIVKKLNPDELPVKLTDIIIDWLVNKIEKI